MQLHLLTGNADKLRHAQDTFGQFGIEVVKEPLKIDEIQAATSREVARAAVFAAQRELGSVAVLREDHSFYIDELGFPGPFMAFADKTISVQALIKIVDTLSHRRGHFNVAAAYLDARGELFETEFSVPVEFATEPRGNSELNWERAIMLEGDTRTFAEVPSETRDHLWVQNYQRVAEFILSRPD